MEIPARKKPSRLTTVPDIYRVSFLVVAVASAPFVLKLLFALLQRFVAVTIPWARDSFSRWLTPPYLFFFLNCIILVLIANSSGWHRKFNLALSNPPDEPQEPDHNRQSLQVTEIDIHRQDSAAPEEINKIIQEPDHNRQSLQVTEIDIHRQVSAAPEEITKIIQRHDSEEAEVIDKGSETPLLEVGESAGSSEAAQWKPVMGIAASNKMLASARFTRRKVSGHESAGFKSLRVNQKHREETLESVWKNITEGRHPPLTRHLRSTPDGSRNDHSSEISARRRCEEECSGGRSGGSLKRVGSLKRESSVGVDDLNKRVEAFINKFNAEMRLQKEDSLLHYMEMINRGA